MRISAIRALTVDVPLDRPIVMGPIRYDSREYVVVEVISDAGLSGLGFGMTRSAPVAQIVDRNITPLLLGENPIDIERLWQRVFDANMIIARDGLFMRALSAVDIALWDLKAKALSVPVWRVLGGYRTRVPAQMAGCYPADDETLDDLRDEVAGYASRGFASVKIAAGSLETDTSRLRAARDAAPTTRLIYDVHWAWRDLAEVLPVVRTWPDLALHALEDPFPSDFGRSIDGLRVATDIPLALGEDYVGRFAVRDLLRSGRADILRVDATTMGGISEVSKIIAMASAEGTPVSPHVFPEVHIHLAAAFGNVKTVELTDPERGYEGLYRLFSSWIQIDGGDLVAPEMPGIGVEIDWGAVDAYRRS